MLHGQFWGRQFGCSRLGTCILGQVPRLPDILSNHFLILVKVLEHEAYAERYEVGRTVGLRVCITLQLGNDAVSEYDLDLTL